jgi:hypothetical protein
VASNWSGLVPPSGAGFIATLGPVITATRNVSLSVPLTIDRININAASGYRLTGLNTLTFDGGSSLALQVAAGTAHEFLCPVVFGKDAAIEVATGASVRFRSGFDTTARDLIKSGGGSLLVRQVRGRGIVVDAGTLQTTGGGTFTGVSKINTLAISGSGKLDLAGQKLVIDYAAGADPSASIRQLIGSGRLISSILAGNAPTLGYADNTLLGLATVDDVSLDATSLLVKVTITGDTNLDGLTNFNDLLALARGYGQPGVWQQGDFDYDGLVGFADLLAIARNYGLSLSSAPGTPSIDSATFAADWARALAAVPEPATLGALAATALIVGRRRR